MIDLNLLPPLADRLPDGTRSVCVDGEEDQKFLIGGVTYTGPLVIWYNATAGYWERAGSRPFERYVCSWCPGCEFKHDHCGIKNPPLEPSLCTHT